MKKLEHAYEVFKTIKEEEFYFGAFVKSSNADCGTVCCFVGWMPKLIPEAGFYWAKPKEPNSLKHTLELYSISKESSLESVSQNLCYWFEDQIREEELIILNLFGIGRRSIVFEGSKILRHNSNLKEVLQEWERSIKFLKTLKHNQK